MDKTSTQDWLQGSVIINDDGTPTPLYHATDKVIVGNLIPSRYGTYGSGIYLGDREANVVDIFGESVVSVCANITNPWRVIANPDSEGAFAEDFDHPSVEAILALPGGRDILENARRNGWHGFGPELTTILRLQGYDGIIATWDDGFREIVAFDEHQVRFLPPADLQLNEFINKSKVVDSEGNPLIVYHGTTGNFTSFDLDSRGKSTGAAAAKSAFFFSSSPDNAFEFANLAAERGVGDEGVNIMPVYLSIKNPLTVDASGQDVVIHEFVAYAEREGHDGLILTNANDNVREPVLTLNGKELLVDINSSFVGDLFPMYLGGEMSAADVSAELNETVADMQSEITAAIEEGAIPSEIYALQVELGNWIQIQHAWKVNPSDFQIKHSAEPATVFAVFDPNQIMSAIGTPGPFAASNPDIRYSLSGGGVNGSFTDLSATQDVTHDLKNSLEGTKIVDEKGEPLVLYHGTQSDIFSEFRPSGEMNMFGSMEQYHFTDSESEAREFATGNFETAHKGRSGSGMVMSVYLKMDRPADLRFETWNVNDVDIQGMLENLNVEGIIPALKEQGYDGIIHDGGLFPANVKGVHYVVFDPAQIILSNVNPISREQYNMNTINPLELSSQSDELGLNQRFGVAQERGRPKLVYRGLPGHLADPGSDINLLESYYTSDPEYASDYALDTEGGAVFPFFVLMSNPYVADDINDVTDWEFIRKRDVLIREGFDGITDKDGLVLYPFDTSITTDQLLHDTNLPPLMSDRVIFALENPYMIKGKDHTTNLPDEEESIFNGDNKLLDKIRFVDANGNLRNDEDALTDTLDQIHTTAFKEWFGNSRLVDNQGKPIVVYHGTYLDFDTFRPGDVGELGPGIYFSKDPDEASEYAGIEPSDSGGRVIPVYLRIENPISEDDAATLELELGGDGAAAEIKRRGHDGIMGEYTVVVYDSEQIKSAIAKDFDLNPQDPETSVSQSMFRNNGALVSITEAVDQTKTQAFAEWFGGSKMVDSDGNPHVFYHGTNAEFSEFKTDKMFRKNAIFFTKDKSLAEAYGVNLIEVYLRAENVLQVTDSESFIKALDDSGTSDIYDGIEYNDVSELGNAIHQMVVFNPNQIKSATGNNGQFDPVNDDIRYSLSENGIHGSFSGPMGQTQTEAFKQWFNNSAVVDSDGEPLLLYHGTNADFDTFDPDASREDQIIFATSKQEVASDFALFRTIWEGANVMPIYVRAEKVLEVDGQYRPIRDVEADTRLNGMQSDENVRAFAKRMGYDAIVFRNSTDAVGPNMPPAADIYALLPTAQIKSATGNNGQFDPANADIRFSQSDKGVYGSFTRPKAQTHTETFQQWFGDSRVLDANGEPLVVYHGTAVSDLTEFDLNKVGTQQYSDWGPGIYLTPSESNADYYRQEALANNDEESSRIWSQMEEMEKSVIWENGSPIYPDGYSELLNDFRRARKHARSRDGGAVMPLYVKIENPYIVEYQSTANPGVGIEARNGGHDGIVVLKSNGEIDEIVAFSPNQIKSATGNTGAFSPDNLDIRYQESEDGAGGSFTMRLDQTKTPAFIKWFADSKVVDDMGMPLAVYHNTDADFTSFRQGEKDGLSGKGIYFSEYPLPQFGKPMKVYLKIENPITPETELDGMREINSSGIPTKFIADIFERFPQFDGIINRSEIVVKSPSQIKSATHNTGTFDPDSQDIRYSQTPEMIVGSFESTYLSGSIDLDFASPPHTDTPEFKGWFGDSHVVDDVGRPLVVYHGTSHDFDSFSKEYFGANEASGDYVGQGFYFTADASKANRYSMANGVAGANLMPVYLAIQKPLIIEGDADRDALYESFGGLVEFYTLMGDSPSRLKDVLQGRGYDGLIDRDYNQYAVFEPTQIKSAIGNTGAFDRNNSDIRYSLTQTVLDGSFNIGFYSGLVRAVETMPQERGTARQFINAIRKQPGVKAEEVEWSGLNEYLQASEAQGGKVSKTDILNYLKSNGVRVEEILLDHGKTQYSDHQLPGGDNYREVLLTLPVDPDVIHDYANNTGLTYRASAQIVQFKSGHWNQIDTSNILAHLRLNDRKDEHGRKFLFVEEIQSDWHQLGRKRGYGTREPAVPHEYEADSFIINETDTQWSTVDINGVSRSVGKGVAQTENHARMYFARWLTKLSHEYANENNRRASDKVPNAPFKGNAWVELAIKRVLRLAAEDEYDAIAWTSGDQQIDRFDLGKHLSRIKYRRHDADIEYYDFYGFNKNEEMVIEEEHITLERIEALAGNDITDKIRKSDSAFAAGTTAFNEIILRGDDNRVGGEGMRGFYDKTMPNIVKKTARKLDRSAFIETAEITLSGDEKAKVHALSISQSLKQSAMEGQSLFRLSDDTRDISTDDIEDRLGKIANDLRRRFMALKIPESIALKVVDSIKHEKQHKDIAGNGLMGVIKIAVDTAEPERTLNHEAIHALKSLGLFKANEWSALERAAKSYHRREEIEHFYEKNNLSDEQMTEEIIAEMYADWSSSEKQTFTVTIRDAFARIRDVIGAIGSALRGNGFTTADSILRRIERGEVGNRFYTSPYNDGSAFRQDKISLDEIDLSNIDIGPDEVESHSISKI